MYDIKKLWESFETRMKLLKITKYRVSKDTGIRFNTLLRLSRGKDTKISTLAKIDDYLKEQENAQKQVQ